MSETIIEVGEGFWNIRGVFRVGGVVNVGTHASLVRRPDGRFVLLDSWTLDPKQKRRVMDLTGGGALVDAILNLHPFHTLHCAAMHRDFPEAKLYGTARHHERLTDLPWQPELIETAAAQTLFDDTLAFDVPRGVEFISADPKLHFSSVLAFHPATGTLHVDDTLTFIRPPALLRRLGMGDRLAFHPALGKVLEQRPGAAAEFRAWARTLATRCATVRTLCAAHVSWPLCPGQGDTPIGARVEAALEKVEPVLRAHENTLADRGAAALGG